VIFFELFQRTQWWGRGLEAEDLTCILMPTKRGEARDFNVFLPPPSTTKQIFERRVLCIFLSFVPPGGQSVISCFVRPKKEK
jgi:hypothetical protein